MLDLTGGNVNNTILDLTNNPNDTILDLTSSQVDRNDKIDNNPWMVIPNAISKNAPDMIDRTINAGEDFAGGVVKGFGDLIDMVGSYGGNPIVTGYNVINNKSRLEPITDPIKKAGVNIANDTNTFPFLAGEVLSPVPSAAPLKTAKAIVNPAMKLFDAAVTPITSRAVNGIKKAIYNPSPRGSFADTAKRSLVQDYRLDDNFLSKIDTANSEIRGVDDLVDRTMKDIKAENLSEYENDMIVDYFRGDLSDGDIDMMNAIDPELMAKARTLKDKISMNTSDLASVNLLNVDDVDYNYLKRVFTDSNHKPQSFTELKNTHMDKNQKGIHTYIRRNDTDKINKAINSGFEDSGKVTEDGRQIWRRPFSADEYKKLGYAKDFASDAGATLEKQGNELIKGNLYEDILRDKNIQTFNNPDEYQGVTERLSKNYGLLDSKYVTPEVKEALDMFSGEGARNVPAQWRRFVNEWKANTVIKNPKSHINNILGNITMSWYGDIPIVQSFNGAKHSMNAAAKAMTGKGDDYLKAMPGYKEAADVGLFGRTSLDEMINQVTGIESRFKPQDLPKINKVPFSDKKIPFVDDTPLNKRNLYLGKDSKYGKKFYDSYRVEDDAFKLSNYNYFRGQGLSPKEARAKVESAVFDYAKQMPKGINYLRDTGLIPFVSWQYKSIPLMAETLAKNPSKLAATTAGLYMLNQMLGSEDNEVGSGKVGKSRVNVNQWTPYQEYLEPQKFGSNLLFGGMPQNILGSISGKDMSFGSPRAISNKDDDWDGTLINYLIKSTDMMPIPAVYKQLGKVGKDQYDNKRSLLPSAVDRLFITNKEPKSDRTRKARNKRPKRDK